MKEISAVINARLESSRVPQKLVRPFAGSTLLEIALSKLNALDFCKHRFLAVADEQLARFADKLDKVEVLWRDKQSVKKGVNPLEVTLKHYLDVPSQWVLSVNPCQPLLSVDTIRTACQVFQETDHVSYISVVPVKDWIFDKEGNPITHKNVRVLATNKTAVYYKASHSFYIVNKRRFKQTGLLWSFVADDPFLITISEEETLDIDTELEFEVLEELYKRKANRGLEGSRLK